MSRSGEPTTVQRIVRAAADLRTFTQTELADKARTQPSTTRVVLKRLQDKWPGAFRVKRFRAKANASSSLNRYSVDEDGGFSAILEHYSDYDAPVRDPKAIEEIVADIYALAEKYLELAENENTGLNDKFQHLCKIDVLLSHRAILNEFEKEQSLTLHNRIHEKTNELRQAFALEKQKKQKAEIASSWRSQGRQPRRGHIQKRLEEKIEDFCTAFISFDFSLFAFDRIVYPVFCEMLDRTSLSSLVKIPGFRNFVEGEVWAQQVRTNELLKSNIRKNVVGHLLRGDRLKENIFDSVVIRDGTEVESYLTALEISRLARSHLSHERLTTLAWRVGETRIALPTALMDPVWTSNRRATLKRNYYDISSKWLSTLESCLPGVSVVSREGNFRNITNPTTHAQLALSAINELQPFSRHTLQLLVRASLIDMLSSSLSGRSWQHSEISNLLSNYSLGQVASLLVDENVSAAVAKKLSRSLERYGVPSFAAGLTTVDPNSVQLVGSAQDLSPTILTVLVNSDLISEKSLSLLENLSESSCVVLDVGTGTRVRLPIASDRCVRILDADNLEVGQLIDASAGSVMASSGDNFELYQQITTT